MHAPSELYRPSLALLTDLYQLTMAYGYWKSGMQRREAVFHLFFRHHPFRGGFTIACGLEYVVDWLTRFCFADDDLAYLATLRGDDGAVLFEPAFFDYLRGVRFSGDLDAAPEGTVVFPNEPLLRVTGSLIEGQLFETALLNIVNFQTLIATKAARVCMAARGDPVIEFGLRRAQGIDGALAASRAAHVGGCAATSSVLAGRMFGIPVKGTHAHSWVMSFDDELSSFEAYAKAMPNNCVFLVDTYDTLGGVRHAIQVGQWLRSRGHELAGIRLDSGDLAYLSTTARKLLDDAGFHRSVIVASNDLDEHLIASLKEQGAAIGVWGVGTKLVTAYDQPALGGVYKLSALRSPGEAWSYRLKLSEQSIKISTPGILQVRRFSAGGECLGDMIYDEQLGAGVEATLVDPRDANRRKNIPSATPYDDLLVPIVRQGRLVRDQPPLAAIRDRAGAELARFSAGVRRFVNPHEYPVGLEPRLFELKNRLVREARGLE
ncbi:MAG TPA: nicotinate phosphoribosyltransferase [Pirellulales bacterium]|nr:nicotinate phosphoribosyltransferase [Pirellulales bacterium]